MSPAAKYAAAEQARLARDPRDFLAPVALTKPPRPEPRGTWSVARVYDDKSQPDRPIRVNLTEADARKVAGELRDGMTDAECGVALTEGWNVVAVNKTKFAFRTLRQRKEHASRAAKISNEARYRKFRGRPR